MQSSTRVKSKPAPLGFARILITSLITFPWLDFDKAKTKETFSCFQTGLMKMTPQDSSLMSTPNLTGGGIL